MSRRGRWLLILAAAAGALALAAVLARPWLARLVAEHARREAIARSAAAIGAPVSIARSAAGFAPVVVVLEGLRLEQNGAFGLRAGSSIEAVEITGRPWALLRWGTGPIDFHVERPHCAIDLAAAAGATPAADAATGPPPPIGAAAGTPGEGIGHADGETGRGRRPDRRGARLPEGLARAGPQRPARARRTR